MATETAEDKPNGSMGLENNTKINEIPQENRLLLVKISLN